MIDYFKGVIREGKRVHWPKGDELKKMTVSVVSVSAIFAVIFIIMDLVITAVMRALGV